MKCPNCGTEFDEGMFCPKCGTKVTETQINENNRANAVPRETPKAEPASDESPKGNTKKNGSSKGKKVGIGCLIVIIAVIVLFVGCSMLFGGSNSSESTSSTTASSQAEAVDTEQESKSEAETEITKADNTQTVANENEIQASNKKELLYAISEYMNTASGTHRDIYDEIVFDNDKLIHITGATLVYDEDDGYIICNFENDHTLDTDTNSYDPLNTDDDVDWEILNFTYFAVNLNTNDEDRDFKPGDTLDILCDYYAYVYEAYTGLGHLYHIPTFDEVSITIAQTYEDKIDDIKNFLRNYGVPVDDDPELYTDDECKNTYYTILNTLSDFELTIDELREELYESDFAYRSKEDVDKLTNWECIQAYNDMVTIEVVDSHNFDEWLRDYAYEGDVIDLSGEVRHVYEDTNEIALSLNYKAIYVKVADATRYNQYNRYNGLARYIGERESMEIGEDNYAPGYLFEEVVSTLPDVEPEESEEEPAEEDYILPDSDKRNYSYNQLKRLSKDELRLARNEIYARHGRIFDSEDLIEYFESKPWYEGTVKASDFDESVLNEYEKTNISTIQFIEAGN